MWSVIYHIIAAEMGIANVDCGHSRYVVSLRTMKMPALFRPFLPALAGIIALSAVGGLQADESITFKSKVVPNKRYVVLQEIFSEMPMPLGGGNAKTTMSFKTNMTVREIKESQNRLISVEMGEVKMLMDAAGSKMEYDSEDESKQNPMLKAVMGGALESKFDAEVDAEGNVVKVTNKGKKAGGMFGGGFGENELKQLVGALFDHGFPENEVKKGHTWEHTQNASNAMTGDMSLKMNYTFEGMGEVDGKSYPKLAVKGSKADTAAPKEGAKKAMAEISKADTVGHMYFDNELGVARESEMTMDMTMTAGGNEMVTKSKVYSKLIKVEDVD